MHFVFFIAKIIVVFFLSFYCFAQTHNELNRVRPWWHEELKESSSNSCCSFVTDSFSNSALSWLPHLNRPTWENIFILQKVSCKSVQNHVIPLSPTKRLKSQINFFKEKMRSVRIGCSDRLLHIAAVSRLSGPIVIKYRLHLHFAIPLKLRKKIPPFKNQGFWFYMYI